MKRKYMKPMMIGEKFVPNECIASCGDNGTIYNFECNILNGAEYIYLYIEDNGQSGLQTGSGGDSLVESGYACGEKHQASSEDDFLPGYYVSRSSGETGQCIVWRQKETLPWVGTRYVDHATSILDKNNWETLKS